MNPFSTGLQGPDEGKLYAPQRVLRLYHLNCPSRSERRPRLCDQLNLSPMANCRPAYAAQ